MNAILQQIRGWVHDYRPSPVVRQLLVAGFYTALLAASLPAAYLLRFDFNVSALEAANCLRGLVWIVPLKLILLVSLGTLRAHLGFFGVVGLMRLTGGLALASVAMLGVRLATRSTEYAPPISVTLMDFVLCLLLIGGVRLLLRLARQYSSDSEAYNREAGGGSVVTRVGIFGAGEAGSMLAQEIQLKPRFRMKPVAFYDDDQSKWGIEIHGVRVEGQPELLKGGGGRARGIERVIIAMPAVGVRRMRQLVALLQEEGIPFQTIPSMDQLTKGHVQVSQIRSVEIEDLLGRDPVKLDTVDIRKLICGQVVMVTGAGGSIGSELCLQIAGYSPARLLLVERSEVQLFQIEQTLIGAGYKALIEPLIADVTDRMRMTQVLAAAHPRIIFHAAAHKHVPMMESQVCEAIKNNILGTALVADLALKHNVERFVLISTDKAINPVNVMGATKRLAELYLQALNARNGGVTRFMAVRFGNVLGSSGSVIPIFKKQIAAGGPVRVTCPEIRRYFMTIPEAVGLVLQCATLGQGGDILVLDMGSPVRIADLARQLIRLSGFRPDEDIAIEFTGLRPGEKCFEELNYTGENYSSTAHPSIMRFTAASPALEKILADVEMLTERLHKGSSDELKTLLQEVVPEYRPRPGMTTPVGDNADTSARCGFGNGLAGQSTGGVRTVLADCPCLKMPRGLSASALNVFEADGGHNR